MSIKIYNGYRIPVQKFEHFIKTYEAILEEVRVTLDARLYAEIVSEIIDTQSELTSHQTREEAQKIYRQNTMEEPKNTIWYHPHSFDLDYSIKTPDGEHIYMLIHAQKQLYIQKLLKQYPVLEHYPYWNNSDPDENITPEQWEQRKKDWEWLINAPTIKSATTRLTYRPDPEPDYKYVTKPETIVKHQPRLKKRAEKLFKQQKLAEIPKNLSVDEIIHKITVIVLDKTKIKDIQKTLQPITINHPQIQL